MIPTQESSNGVAFAVKVYPRAKKNAITGELGNALKLSLSSRPIDGEANKACIAFFAKLLKVPRSSVSIASGQCSRNKTIRILELSAEELAIACLTRRKQDLITARDAGKGPAPHTKCLRSTLELFRALAGNSHRV
jgi:uncharacterized protein